MSIFPNQGNPVKRECIEQSEVANTIPANRPDVDMSVLLAFEEVQCEGEPDLIVELIDLYLTNVLDELAAMKNCVLKAEQVSLKRAAHNLKGGSANLGVNGIAEICEEIEQTDFNESFQESNILIDRLEQTFARIRPIFLAERERRF